MINLGTLLIKGSRFSKVSGQFGEILVAYLLSKNGFEVAQVDHSGLDILAFRRNPEKRLGISVKNRARNPKNPNWSVNFRLEDLKRLEQACEAFSAKPFVAAVVDRLSENVSVWILPLNEARKHNTVGEKILYFAVTKEAQLKYRNVSDAFYASLRWEP